MGKSNRIRSNRAAEQVVSLGAPKAKKKKKGMPGWLMTLLTIVIAATILFAVAFNLMLENGVFNRMRTAVSSENFRVNNNMMTYYFQMEYQSFLEDNQTYIEYGYYSLNTSLPLKDQVFGGTVSADSSDSSTYYLDTTLVTDTANMPATWFDYFMDNTVTSVKSMLLYCEEAEARGIELSEEELDSIEANLDSIANTASSSYGYPLDAYLSATYGTGVRTTDVRKAMKYSSLATKAMNALTEELNDSIAEDRIHTEYDANKKDFNLVDYSYYSFEVNYDDVAMETLGVDETTYSANGVPEDKKETVLEAYRKAVEEARAKADALALTTDAEAFRKYIANALATEAVDEVYAEQTIAADITKPSDEDFATIKEGLIDALITDAFAEYPTTGDAVAIPVDDDTVPTVETVVLYNVTVDAKFAQVINTVKTTAYSDVLSGLSSYIRDKASFTEGNDFSTWAFDDTRAVGNTTVISSGDGADGAEIAADAESYSSAYIYVYLLRATQYRDAEKSKNVSYILFSDEEMANTAISELKAKGTITLDIFKEYANGITSESAHAVLEDYTEGSLGSETFDEWLYSASTVLGSITDTPLELDDSTFCIALYYGEGAEIWHVTVKNSLLTQDFEAYYDNMEVSYPITVKERALKKIGA